MVNKYASGSYDIPHAKNMTTSIMMREFEDGLIELEFVVWWSRLFKDKESAAALKLQEKTFREGLAILPSNFTKADIFNIYVKYLTEYLEIAVRGNLIKKYPTKEELVDLLKIIIDDLLEEFNKPLEREL